MAWTEKDGFGVRELNNAARAIAEGLTYLPRPEFIAAGIDRKVVEEWSVVIGKLLDERFSYGFAKIAQGVNGPSGAIKTPRLLPATKMEFKQLLDHTASVGKAAVTAYGSEALQMAYANHPQVFNHSLENICSRASWDLGSSVPGH